MEKATVSDSEQKVARLRKIRGEIVGNAHLQMTHIFAGLLTE